MTGANGTAVNGTSSRLDAISRFDGWRNWNTQYGDPDRDRTLTVEYAADRLGYQELRERWEGDDLCASYVEKPAKAMLRRGVRIRTGNRDIDDAVRGRFDVVGLVPSMRKAVEYSRAYGLGVVYLNFDDGLHPAVPVPRGARLIGTTAFDQNEIRAYAQDWELDIRSPRFMTPRIWTAYLQTGELLRIHPSRLLVILGRVVSNWDRRNKLGAGSAGLARFSQKVSDFDGAVRSLLNILADFSVGVIGIKNLVELLSSDDAADGSKALQRRVIAFNLARSAGRLVPIDADLETYTRVTSSITGFSEALDRLMVRLAAAAGMPVTVLFGRSPAGLNATGESDIRGWYDELAGQQTEDLAPHFDHAARFVIEETVGGPFDGDYTVEFPPLWMPTEKETAEVRETTSKRVVAEVNAGILTKDEAAQSLYGGEEWSPEIQLNREARVKAAPAVPVANDTQPAPAAPADLESTALNGAQVTAALQIVQAVGARTLPRQSAVEMLVAFFQLPRDAAERVLGPVGQGFQPAPQVAA